MIALAVALGTAAAGCGTSVSPGVAGASQEDDVAVPSLRPTVEPETGMAAGQQPAAPPVEQVEDAAEAAGQALSTTTSPATAQASAAAPGPEPAPTATIPVSVAGPATAPEGGHPPAPQAGMIPRANPYWDYPNCAPGPPWPSDCYPPSEWEVPQDPSGCGVSGRTFRPDLGVGGICAGSRADERPRWTRDVARWTTWCFDQPRGNCTWLLFEMKWALDYLGAHPWCVLNEYQDRAAAYGAGRRGNTVRNGHGWHNCATVIDPLVRDTTPGRTSDAGLLLSDTVSLAEQCRIVLPPDVELETRTRRFSEEPERFGSDCDAWAQWVQGRPKAWDWRDCDRSARIAEEWMEHHHATPERYFNVTC